MKTQTPAQADYAAVLELLETYYEGLYHTDVSKLESAFSPSARYATIANGSLLELSLDEYLPRVAQRTSPAEEGAPFEYQVRSIRFAGAHTALAELSCSLFGHDYTDFLSLLRIDGQWRIQTKVFEGVPQRATEEN